MMITMDPPLTECPHCGDDTYYLRIEVSGTITERRHFRTGDLADNHGMWDSAQLRPRKTVYCNGCEKRIAVVI